MEITGVERIDELLAQKMTKFCDGYECSNCLVHLLMFVQIGTSSESRDSPTVPDAHETNSDDVIYSNQSF